MNTERWTAWALSAVLLASAVGAGVGAGAGAGAGAPASTAQEDGPIEITDWNDLDSLHSYDGSSGRDIVLKNDLNASTRGYESVAGPDANGGKGFDPIRFRYVYRGTIDGRNHEIADLVVDRPDSEEAALFADLNAFATVENLVLANVSVTGKDNVGALVGVNWAVVRNVTVSGTVEGESYVGGVAGTNYDNNLDDRDAGIVANASVNASVSGGLVVGGVVGDNDGVIDRTSATGSVVGRDGPGGSGQIVGGIAGTNENTIVRSYTAGEVRGTRRVGGIVGKGDGTVERTYSLSDVSADSAAGGIIGLATYGDRVGVRNSYAAGRVSGDEDVGGAVGKSRTTGVTAGVYWDAAATGQSGSALSPGSHGLTTDEMRGDSASEVLTPFDFGDNWTEVVAGESIPPAPEADGYPVLRAVDAGAQLDAREPGGSPETNDSRGDLPVPRRVFVAVTGGDGTLSQDDLLSAVRAYASGRSVGGVDLTRGHVLSLVRYYVDQ